MKRKIIALLIILLMTSITFAQTNAESDEVKSIWSDLSDDIGPALPFAAATTGNNWDDAYIGKLPHWGLGLSAGIVLIPTDALDRAYDTYGIEQPEDTEEQDYIPLVLGVVDFRLGGIISPFDIGIKYAGVSQDLDDESQFEEDSNVLIDYVLFGIDFRYALVEQTLFKPDISIGMGLNYYKTALRVHDEETEQIILTDIDGEGTNVNFGDSPDFGISMESFSVDFKAQISKSILILVPYGGVGASFGTSKVGGGLYADTDISGSVEALEAAGYTVEGDRVFYENEYTGWSPRVFFGAGINLAILRFNAQVSLNPETEAIALSANLRLQF